MLSRKKQRLLVGIFDGLGVIIKLLDAKQIIDKKMYSS